jgi:DNA invertase Pin-like site-specific DNA recombinase
MSSRKESKESKKPIIKRGKKETEAQKKSKRQQENTAEEYRRASEYVKPIGMSPKESKEEKKEVLDRASSEEPEIRKIIREEKESVPMKKGNKTKADDYLSVDDRKLKEEMEIKEKVRVWTREPDPENPIKRKGIVYCYLRKSTVKQVNSIESQTMEIMKYCKNFRPNPLILLEENIHVDEGVSGKLSWKKRKVKAIIDNMLAGDTLIVYDISRISRDVFDLFAIASIIRDKKLLLIGVMNPGLGKIDGSPQCTSMLHCLSVCAQIELTNISYRTKSALAAVKKTGKMICGETRVINSVNETTGQVEKKQVPRLGTTYHSKAKECQNEVENDVRAGIYTTADICERNKMSTSTFYKILKEMTSEERGDYHQACIVMRKEKAAKLKQEKLEAENHL